MSILIKGMDMPESCWRCPFCLTIDPDTYRCIPTGHEFESTFDAINHIVCDCPLVERPDELAKNVYYEERETHCDFKCSLCGATIGCVECGTMDGARFHYCPNCGAEMEREGEEWAL